MIGTSISHDRITVKPCGGGMGVVYKAEDTKLHRFVAPKFLPEELQKPIRRWNALDARLSPASALNHPNIWEDL